MNLRILLAEDHEEAAEALVRELGGLGHEVVIAGDGTFALELAKTGSFDLFILDRMMPRIDGLEVLRQLRALGMEQPAIMLTALGQIDDRVQGLDAGADDYLTKPFALSELVARMNALIRRSTARQAQTRLVVGSLELDLLLREVSRKGVKIPLQPKEFRLLEELMRNEGEFVTRTMLLERVWNFHFDPQTKIVETHMSRLRAKLCEGGIEDLIETRRGIGYRITAA